MARLTFVLNPHEGRVSLWDGRRRRLAPTNDEDRLWEAVGLLTWETDALLRQTLDFLDSFEEPATQPTHSPGNLAKHLMSLHLAKKPWARPMH